MKHLKFIYDKCKTLVLAIIFFLVLLGLFGCSSAPIIPTEVKVPTPVACISPDAIPVPPVLSSLKDDKNTQDGDLMLHLAQDLAALKMYSDKLRVIAESCSKL